MYLLGTGYQRSGKNSRVVVGGTTLNQSRFDVTLNGDDLDTTNFESGGYGEGILGIQECDASFGGDWDAGDNPIDANGDPPGLYPRDDLADLQLYQNVTDATYWDFGYFRIRSARNGSEVRGKVSFECSGKSQGIFVLPTGNGSGSGDA